MVAVPVVVDFLQGARRVRRNVVDRVKLWQSYRLQVVPVKVGTERIKIDDAQLSLPSFDLKSKCMHLV